MTLREELQRRVLLHKQAARLLREESQELEELAQHHDAKANRLSEVLIEL